MKNKLLIKSLVIGVIILFIGASIVSGMAQFIDNRSEVNVIHNLRPTTLENGLVGYWSFDDGTATDNSGNGHTGVINGASVVSGVINQALFFDGTDDTVLITDPSDFQFADQSLTFATWVQILDNPELESRIFMSLGDVTDGYPHIMLGKHRAPIYDGRIYFEVRNHGEQGPLCFSNDNGDDLSKNEWMHVAGVLDYSGDKASLYINGVVQDSQPLVNFDMADAVTLRLIFGDYCRQSPAYSHKHHGPLDEVRIYNKALSADEVKELYKEPFKLSFVIGRINNLNTVGSRISFQAEKLRIIQFAPFQLLQFSSNEEMLVLNKYLGILNPNIAFGFFRVFL